MNILMDMFFVLTFLIVAGTILFCLHELHRDGMLRKN